MPKSLVVLHDDALEPNLVIVPNLACIRLRRPITQGFWFLLRRLASVQLGMTLAHALRPRASCGITFLPATIATEPHPFLAHLSLFTNYHFTGTICIERNNLLLRGNDLPGAWNGWQA